MPDTSEFTPLETAIVALLTSGDAKPIRGTTRFQKMAFLLAHMPGTPELREEMGFEALHFGPFSEVLGDTVKMMQEADLVSVTGPRPKVYSLAPNGATAAAAAKSRNPKVFEESERLKVLLLDVPQNDLITLVYELYPDYAEESEIKGIASENVDAIHVGDSELGDNQPLHVVSKKGKSYEVVRRGRELVIRDA